MTRLRVLAARIRAFLLRGRRDAELDEEIEAHLAFLALEYERRGSSPTEARAVARREFGGVEQVKERYRDQRGLPLLEALGQDLRYGARTLRRAPLFTLVIVSSLALGIGAATAAFSVFNAVMLRPLPVPEPHRLVLLQTLRDGERWIVFNPVFEELRREQRALSGMFAVSGEPFVRATLHDDADASYISAALVSGDYFRVLGVTMQRGRPLEASDDEPGAPCVAVASARFWEQRLEADPAVLGRTIRVKEAVCSIVGVVPDGFEGHGPGRAPDVWLALRRMKEPKLLASRSMAFFSGVMGRLRPGISIREAETELDAIYRRIPQSDSGTVQLRLLPGASGLDHQRRQYGESLSIILGVTGALLLIASLNVATLLLARGAARLPEFGTRAALGAGRGRLLRQLATEGTLIAVLGGMAGAALAWLGTPALGALISPSLGASVDGRVVAAAVAATGLTAIVAGLLPAWRLSRAAGPIERVPMPTRRGQRLMRTLVAAQLALSLLLVASASLLLRSLVRLDGVELGFEPKHVVSLHVADETPGTPGHAWGDVDTADARTRRAARYRSAEEGLRALPGVSRASLSFLGLFSRADLWKGITDSEQPAKGYQARFDYVSADYFETVGMRIVQGRGFTHGDREDTERVAVVNESMARERLRQRALGRRLSCDVPGVDARPYTVVGVVRDSRYNDPREARTEPMIWIPLAQGAPRANWVNLRVAPGLELQVARQAQAALAAADPYLMVRTTGSLSAQVARTTERERLLLGLTSGFASVALLLAALGLYGTLAYAVTRRTREIGVRLALGAESAALRRMILGDALVLTGWAVIVGLPLALIGGRALRAFLFGVAPEDPVTLGGACAVLVFATLVAAFPPARRATSIDPATALRAE